MSDAWNTLLGFGLPDGAPRPRPRAIDFPQVRTALAAIDPSRLDAVQRAALLAWLEGWRHHWPSRFERELGVEGERLRIVLHARPFDRGRYMKLRRIATENLAAVL